MPTSEPDAVDALTRVLVRACRKLADVGYPREAGRLAAAGWVACRADHPRQALHLDGVMHHIARVEASLDTAAADGDAGPAADRSADHRPAAEEAAPNP